MDEMNAKYDEAIQAYRNDKIIKGQTTYLPDFGLCVLLDSIEDLPADRKTRYQGSDFEDDLSVYAYDEPGEYMQFALKI